MTGGDEIRRRLFPAPVGPWTCYVILRDHGEKLVAKAAALEAVGREEQGRDIRASLEWMRQAADQLRAPSPEPRTDAEPAYGEAGLSTSEVAERLGLRGPRQVINLLGRRLDGEKVDGVWVIDPVSVDAELRRRKSIGSLG